MTFSAAMLAEFAKPNGEFYKRLTVNFPQTTETITLQPDATELADGNHTLFGAATIHEALDDPVATPDTNTYVIGGGNDTTAESRVSFPSLPAWVLEIVEVRIYCRATSQQTAGTNDGSWIFAARVGADNYFGEIENSRFFNPDYKTMVVRFTESPDTTSAWTVAELNALEVSIISQPDGFGDNGGVRFTQVYVEVDATRSQVGRYSDTTINSKADGMFAAKVTSWSDVTYSVSGSSNAIQRPALSVSIADTDQELSQIFAGSGVDEVRRSTVICEYVSPNVARADWGTVFTGVLTAWDEKNVHEWALDFIQDDSPLEGHTPKAKVSDIDFESADPKAYDKFYQIVYGRHTSETITDDGMIECPNVDKILWRRLVARHRVKEVLNVYSKGNKEDPAALRVAGASAGNATTAQYQIITPVINGIQMTIVEFNLTGASDAEIDKFNELTISADVDGIEDVGDGTGFLITNPSEMFKHYFVNFVANDYGSGAWFADSTAPIDTALFEETRLLLNLLGQESSRLVGGTGRTQRARAELNGFCKDLNLRAFWTELGELGILANSPFSLTVYIDDPWFKQGLHDLDDPQFRYDSSDLFDRILLSHLHQANGDQFLANIEIRDFESAEEKVETFKSFWLPSGIPTP